MSTEASEIVTFYSNVSQKHVQLNLNPLPAPDEVIKTLTNEKPHLKHWITFAKRFYTSGKPEIYCEILEKAREAANFEYGDSEADQMKMLDGLAAYYVGLAKRETSTEAKQEHIIKATRLYTAADKIIMFNEDHLLGRAFLCLSESEKIDQAEAQLGFVLDQNPNNPLGMIGKARINFMRNEIKLALGFYRSVLKQFPDNLPFLRVAIGICLYKLGKLQNAKLAFERALELDPRCSSALTALAIITINEKSADSIRNGMQLLTKAYSIDPRNPLVLNLLGDHFFYKNDYEKVEKLASQALQLTNNNHVRSFSFYLLGKCCHVKENNDSAFNYYYQSAQLASAKFTLPHYGLGQIYMMREEFQNAIDCFEKVLSINSQNVETIKLLCLCYLKLGGTENMNKAKDLYKKLVVLFPEDDEAWIGLAHAQFSDPKESLTSYLRAIEIKVPKGVFILPEIYNNIGSLYFRLNEFVESKKYFELALNSLESSTVLTESTHKPITATLRYNLGRVYEKFGNIQQAETMYQEVLKDFPDYIECYLRLGDILKHRGDFRASSEWFNMALMIDPENSEAWLHIANLHLKKQEFGPAQKKFEKVRSRNPDSPDQYAWLSLGNIWLSLVHSSSHDPVKKRKFSERCLSIFKSVLKRNPKNICAANGIGCVLAYNSYASMARDIFSQCREATADIMDIWLNLGHIYMESKQYNNAIKMYEGCYEKFCNKTPNPEVLIYLARAFYKAQHYGKAKRVLLKIMFYTARHLVALFNLSLILQKNAYKLLQKERTTLADVQTAIAELELAQRNFSIVEDDSEQCRIDPRACQNEKKACSDLLIQAGYQLKRAKKHDEQEAELLRIHRSKLEELARVKNEEQQRELENQRIKEQEMAQKRQEYLKSVQQTLLHTVVTEEKPKKGKNKNLDIIVDDHDSDDSIQPIRKRKTDDGKASKTKKVATLFENWNEEQEVSGSEHDDLF
ncbi:RNA polymerase-associated protein CTR9 [Thelohanellus kitauei]|uniref:RNA polymerase-associated protein CTR9 n=1 Tax=Thelohanellus kitauei TaxID=669202 RepID=A0A0C2MD09_THEKT|nr:RNA polymerase-associated protein CTR9 [Thelohanellus kitauei]